MSAKAILSNRLIGNKRKSNIHWLDIRRHRLRMSLIMLYADLFGFATAAGLLVVINLLLRFFVFQWDDLRYAVVVFICLAFYLTTRLYPGMGLNPAEEIRLVFINTSLGFLVGITLFGAMQLKWHPNYIALFPFGFFCMVFVLVFRWGFRVLSVQLNIWGAPVVVVGNGKNANRLARYFLERRRLGFVPRYVVTDAGGKQDVTVPIPTIHPKNLARYPAHFFSEHQIFTALIDSNGMQDTLSVHLTSKLSELFPRLIYISTANGMAGSSMRIHDLEGIVGVEMKKNILNPFDTFIKRSMDIVFSSLLLIGTLPLWALTMLLIRLDSPGPIFYTQTRVGRNRHGKYDTDCNESHQIRIHKFRTMVMDADKKLEECLRSNLQAQHEWNSTQKLRNDPRITRMGKWLRKFSIDELPQLINILKGEMSLVGPRPILLNQISHYGDKIDAYHSIRPGLTGLWQVSGRNNTSFDERATFDHYYISNWSVWLDIYILLRTVWVVINRDGAY
jgi:Undecaprenyl-phosphate galactose phosphotransferase WbaP